MIQIQKIINGQTSSIDVLLKYPNRLHKKEDYASFTSAPEIDAFINRKVKSCLIDTLSAYVKQRHFVMKHFSCTLGGNDVINHINHLYNEVEHMHSKSVTVVMASIYWLEKSIYAIAPSHTSKHRKYFEEVIEPMIEFCRLYSFEARRKART